MQGAELNAELLVVMLEAVQQHAELEAAMRDL